jgi:hypothetical protein
MAARRSLEPAAARAVEKCAGYLSAHSRLLHYDAALLSLSKQSEVERRRLGRVC